MGAWMMAMVDSSHSVVSFRCSPCWASHPKIYNAIQGPPSGVASSRFNCIFHSSLPTYLEDWAVLNRTHISRLDCLFQAKGNFFHAPWFHLCFIRCDRFF